MKKSTSLLLTCAMGITLLAGCGNNAQTAETSTTAAIETTQQTTTTAQAQIPMLHRRKQRQQ